MKPRSGVERKFIGYAEELPPAREAVAKWAYSHCFSPVALWWQHRGKNNREIWCQCCGHREPCDGWLVMSSDVWVCPECGARCEVKDYKAGKGNDSALVSTIEVFKGVQVVRTFEASRCNYNDGGKTQYSITELYQIWMLENGREIITTIGYDRAYNYFRWNFGGPYSIGRHSCGGSGYYYFEDVYNVNSNWMYPRMNISQYFRTRGVDGNAVRWFRKTGVNITDAFCALAKDARMETLLKTEYPALFARFVKGISEIDKYWRSINICHRHGYAINDASLWCDHVDMLSELGMDIHNPKYICPENLHKQHALISRRLTRQQDREQLERDIRSSAGDEDKYREKKGRFFGLVFRGEHVTIAPIKSVREVAKEGIELHHCVFAQGYYKKPDSLLLSARDKIDNSRVETIELDLKTFRVLQSRGHCNQDSPYHKEILSLLEDNIGQVRKIALTEV